jgi:hypothetical protein
MESQMSRAAIFRTLVVSYLISFIASYVSYHNTVIPAQAEQYAQLLESMFFNPWGSIFWTNFFYANFFVMIAGAIILMLRVRPGLYLFVIGSLLMRVSVFVNSNTDAYPILQSTTSSQIYGMTCILWGAIVAIALWDKNDLFKIRQ